MPEPPTRVVCWFNQPMPYVVARFDAVAKRGSIEFAAWFRSVRQSDRSWDVDETEWKFAARYLPARRLLGIPLRGPMPELLHTSPDVFVLEHDRPNPALGGIAGQVVAKRLAFRVLPNLDAWSHCTRWREAAKHLLFRTADGVKVAGPDRWALAMRYGAESFGASVVRRSIHLARYGTARAMTPEERATRRSAVGPSGCVFLFAGRSWRGKNLDELFTAYRNLESQLEDKVSLLIVGDGVDEARCRRLFDSLPRVVLPGFVQPVELPQWSALADCLVFPTHGNPKGPVVEDAFAAGLPVTVSDAAGDVCQRVPEGDAGYVFPVGSADGLHRSMAKWAMDPVNRRTIANRAVELVRSK